jgi:peptidoglycan hydrolase-like protein with peptidoglycan-binding domain
MSGAPRSVADSPAPHVEMPDAFPRRTRRKSTVFITVFIVLGGGGAAVAFTSPFSNGGQAKTAVFGNAAPVSLATVTSEHLSARVQVNGALGYAGRYTIFNQVLGRYTALPTVGQVIHQGEVLYRLSDNPVVLLYGPVPAYRALSAGMSGPDVRQLNAALVALGYATRTALDPHSDYFSTETEIALEKLQQHLGVDASGELALGQAVFLPSAARISTVNAIPGGAAPPGSPAVQATSTARLVSIALDAAQQSDVRTGDRVVITLPGDRTTAGVVASVGKVATLNSTGSSTVEVDIIPAQAKPTGTLDQAPVQVAITTASVDNALAVPVDALLSQPGGGYAVEVAGAGGTHRMVPVSPGLFDDASGQVQVTGSGLAVGQRVVVPAS